jgi:hypothetical protein
LGFQAYYRDHHIVGYPGAESAAELRKDQNAAQHTGRCCIILDEEMQPPIVPVPCTLQALRISIALSAFRARCLCKINAANQVHIMPCAVCQRRAVDSRLIQARSISGDISSLGSAIMKLLKRDWPTARPVNFTMRGHSQEILSPEFLTQPLTLLKPAVCPMGT